jgi:predicted amidohydrolase YtcJ
MNKPSLKSIVSNLLIIVATLACARVMAQTNLIFNVNGYTMQGDKLQQFCALQFTDDQIDRVFDCAQALPTEPSYQRIDGQGKNLLPGLIDAHGHVLNYGLSLLRADLAPSKSAQEAVAIVQQYAKSHPTLTWLQGRGWNQVQWPDQQYPNAKHLDAIFPNNPVWLRRVDGHAGWANSKAMALAGITKQSKSPAGGDIIRDATGEPTGIFIDNAMALIDQAIAPLTIAEQKSVLLTAMQHLAALGLTSVHDAGVNVSTINAYQQLVAEHKMPIRINAMLDITDPQWITQLKQGVIHTADDNFKLHSVKISADGALGSRGAALHEDYSDLPQQRGLLLHAQQTLVNDMKLAMLHGFQVNTHAIGDRANHLLLNHYQTLIQQTGTKALRHRIEHAQVIQRQDIPRFVELGVIPSMQATHATSDKNMALARLGAERLQGAYAWRNILATGSIIANGSDFPVEPANPFFGLHAAITRQDRVNQPIGGWLPEQKMTRIEAFKSFTLDAAYAGLQESIIGTLTPGKKADFILVSDDIFNQAEQDIWQNTVLATWVNGQQVYLAKQR